VGPADAKPRAGLLRGWRAKPGTDGAGSAAPASEAGDAAASNGGGNTTRR
jgi:hypothetical protein